MSNNFGILTDEQWQIIEPLVARKHSHAGRPYQDFRPIINSIFYVLFNGSRWIDIPNKSCYANRSTSHRWLKKWTEDGTLNYINIKLLKLAYKNKKIDTSKVSIDGSFSPR